MDRLTKFIGTMRTLSLVHCAYVHLYINLNVRLASLFLPLATCNTLCLFAAKMFPDVGELFVLWVEVPHIPEFDDSVINLVVIA